MDTAVLLVVGALVVGLWVAGISALVSAIRLPGYAWQAAKRSRAGTVLGILLTCGFGGVYYWLSVRGPVKAAQGSVAPPPKRDPWSTGDW